jgi:hypothetical protein
MSMVPQKVSQAMNEKLIASFTGDEVIPFFRCTPERPLAQTAIQPTFFQRRWDLCGDEVSDFSYLLGSFQWGRLEDSNLLGDYAREIQSLRTYSC